MNEVKFIDTSKECKDQMKYLSRQALKSAGKVVNKILKDKLPVKTGNFKKSVKAWVKIDYKTGQPELDVGYLNKSQMRKRGVKFFVNPTWFEFGTKPHGIETVRAKMLTDGINKFGAFVGHPGMSNKNFLRNTVFDNINEIKTAQEQFLGELNTIIVNAGGSVPEMEDEEID